jgi:hypothetical protein
MIKTGTVTLVGTPTNNGDGSYTINASGSDVVKVPSLGIMRGDLMWFACRCNLGFASTDTTNRRFMTWGPDTNSELYAEWTTSSQVGCGRDLAGSSSGEASLTPSSFLINTDHTIIAQWTPNDQEISFDGGAFTLNSTTKDIGTPAALGVDYFAIGARGYTGVNQAEAIYWWAAVGWGLISTADRATLHGFGNTGPSSIRALPGDPRFYWSCDSTSYDYLDDSPIDLPQFPLVLAA